MTYMYDPVVSWNPDCTASLRPVLRVSANTFFVAVPLTLAVVINGARRPAGPAE